MQAAGLFLAFATIALALVLGLASLSFRRRTATLWARAGQGPSGLDQSAALPPLVRDFALKSGAQVLPGQQSMVLTSKAELRLKRGGLFSRFAAHQIIAVGEPAFVWHARRGIGPLTLLRVVDALIEHQGRLEARLFGAIAVARADDVETTLGEAYRYLAELPWMPDAILGNPALNWRMLGDGEAEVKLNTRVGTARVSFRFDAAGDIVAMEARDRPARDAAGKPVRYDWRGQVGDYRQIGARRLPAYGEVGYDYPEGFEIYYRGRITDCRPA